MTPEITLQILIYVLATITGIVYTVIVTAWRRRFGDDGMAAVFVMFGCGIVAVFVWWLWGVQVMASLLLLYVVTGIWQVGSYYYDYGTSRKRDDLEID